MGSMASSCSSHREEGAKRKEVIKVKGFANLIEKDKILRKFFCNTPTGKNVKETAEDREERIADRRRCLKWAVAEELRAHRMWESHQGLNHGIPAGGLRELFNKVSDLERHDSR